MSRSSGGANEGRPRRISIAPPLRLTHQIRKLPTTQEDWVLPLTGITVVTLEHAVAAPFATRQLADLGRVSSRSNARERATLHGTTTSRS
jgi:hypothetical protein